MAKLTKLCNTCHKPADEVSRKVLADFHLTIISLKCGHSYSEKILPKKNWEELETGFGRKAKLYPYQGLGYEFARAANFRALIADEPGLGKTFQALACIKLHPDELLPCLFVVKSSLKLQVMKEILRLCGIDYMPQIIMNSNDKPNDTFPVCIVTYDMLWRITKKQNDAYEKAATELRRHHSIKEFEAIPEDIAKQLPSLENPFQAFNFKTVILDECQQIKNPTSRRAQQVREICREVPHILALSGSPIENHAGEYFTVLNILKPERFRTYKYYVENYCDYYENSRGNLKIGGLRDIEWFKSQTSDFIIRRKQKDVLPDLPTLNRKFINCEFANAKIEKEYDALVEEFVDFHNEHEGEQDFAQGLLARMAKMRHKVGINKVPFTTEFALDFILDTEKSRKLTIFVHHQDVGNMLALSLSKEFKALRDNGSEIKDPLTFTADLNAQKRNQVLQDFEQDENCRVLIASTLAASEGLNLQFCSDCILMERQWNPKKEEQAERRFIRPEGAKVDSVNANYILVAGTIDEYLTELVEVKRANTDQTLDGVEYSWNEASLIKELGEVLARKGGKKFRLQ